MTQHFTDLENLYNNIDSDDCSLYNRSLSFDERVHAVFMEMHKESLKISKQLTNAARETKSRNLRFQISQAAK